MSFLLVNLFLICNSFCLLTNATEISIIEVEIFDLDLLTDEHGSHDGKEQNLNHPIKDKHLVIIPSPVRRTTFNLVFHLKQKFISYFSPLPS